mgnify:CR=1 FL=1
MDSTNQLKTAGLNLLGSGFAEGEKGEGEKLPNSPLTISNATCPNHCICSILKMCQFTLVNTLINIYVFRIELLIKTEEKSTKFWDDEIEM